jgi:hypothetical protein
MWGITMYLMRFADYLQGRKDKKLVGYVIILQKMRMFSITICKRNMACKKAVT